MVPTPQAGPPGASFFDVVVDGQRVYGFAHEPLDRPARAIVVSAHGFNGERVDAHRMLVKAARAWAELGLIAIRFDHRGCGLSEGEFWRSLPLARVDDVAAVVAHARTRYPGLPLVLHGFSDSCRVMLMSAARLRPEGVVLWSPILSTAQSTYRPGPQARWQRHPDHPQAIVRPYLGHWLSYNYLRDTAELLTPELHGAALLVVCPVDDQDVIPSLDALAATYGATDMLRVADAGHLYATPHAEATVIRHTGEWMLRMLDVHEGKEHPHALALLTTDD